MSGSNTNRDNHMLLFNELVRHTSRQHIPQQCRQGMPPDRQKDVTERQTDRQTAMHAVYHHGPITTMQNDIWTEMDRHAAMPLPLYKIPQVSVKEYM